MPKNSVMATRWILIWKKIDSPAVDKHGKACAHAAMARLVAKGFIDSDLVTVFAESSHSLQDWMKHVAPFCGKQEVAIQRGGCETACLHGRMGACER